MNRSTNRLAHGGDNHRMIRKPRPGNEASVQMAENLGCKLVEALPRHGHSRPGLVDCDEPLAAQLKGLGARWDPFNHALVFAGWPALQGALRYVIEKQQQQQRA